MALAQDGGGLDGATKLRLMYDLVRVLLLVARQSAPGPAGDLSGFLDMAEGGARNLMDDPPASAPASAPECPS